MKRNVEIHHEEEFCPSCGEFVDALDDETGFCYTCIGDARRDCLACGKQFRADQTHRKLCPSCRDERWLQQHAEEVEVYLSYGARIEFARRQVYFENRPVCIACGQPIKGATNGAVFCTRTIVCRKWRRRYRTLREKYESRGARNSQKLALAEVSAEIFAFQHTMELKHENVDRPRTAPYPNQD